jgi:preprotein translocase subunit YajC
MLINQAFASDAIPVASDVAKGATSTASASTVGVPTPPDSTDLLLWNVGFVVVMIFLFYLLLIRPQQSRYREHAGMLGGLKRGDKIVLQSGMIATIDNINKDNDEVTVEIGSGVKVQILRAAIAGTYAEIARKK